MVYEDSRTLLAAADAAMRSGDTQSASGLLERVVAQGNAGPDDLLRVAATRRALGDVVGALDAVGGALRLRPEHFLSLLMGGSLLVRLGRREEATRAYEAAIRIAPPDHVLPPTLIRELNAGRAHVENERRWRASILTMEIEGLDEATPAERDRIARFRAALAARSDGDINYPDLEPASFVDTSGFEGIAALEAGFEAIRAEFLALAASQSPSLFSFLEHTGAGGGDAKVDGAGQWSVMQLLADGVPVAANVGACPETMRLYGALPTPAVEGRSPNLMFSILDPRTRIPAHRGVPNTRLVLHLPLIVPDGCAIRVGDETRGWTPGEAMIFDDTMEHEAWNDSDQPRIILLGDLWRPELSAIERRAIATLTRRTNN